MKKFLLMLFLACGATAMANNTDPIQEKRVNAATQQAQAAKDSAAKTLKAEAASAKPEAGKYSGSTSHICSDNSRYGLGAYLVEFINRSNVKIMRKLLID